MAQFNHRKIMLVLAIILGLIWMFFIVALNQQTLWGDQYSFLQRYMAITNGKQSWTNIWQPHGGHRLPGYFLLFIANLKLFGYKPLLESLPFILTYIVCVIYIVRTLTDDLARHFGARKTLLILFGGAATLWLMNGQNFAISAYSFISIRFFSFALFVAMAMTAFKFLSAPEKPIFRTRSFWLFILLSGLSLLVFGMGWSIPAAASVIGLAIIFVITGRGPKTAINIKRAAAIIIPLMAFTALYLNGVIGGSGHALAGGMDFGAFAEYYFKRLGTANLIALDAEFLTNNIAGSLQAGEAGERIDFKVAADIRNRLAAWAILFSAFYFLFAAVITIWTLTRKSISKADWLALFLIFYPVLAAFTVAMSRFDQSAYAIRHGFEISVGVAGLLYFLIKWASHLNNRWASITMSVFCAAMIGFSGWTLARTVMMHSVFNSYYQETAEAVQRSVQRGATVADYRRAQCLRTKEAERVKRGCRRMFKFITQQDIMTGVIGEVDPKRKRREKPKP